MAPDRDTRLLQILNNLKLNDSDEGAWRGLYDSLWPSVFANVFRHLHGVTQLAEDASQEVFIRLARYGTFARIGDVVDLRRYVAAIAHNVAKDYQKSYGKWERHTPLPGENTPSPAAPPDATCLARDRLRQMSKGLGAVDQQILKLRAEGYTNSEIARQLGMSKQNAAVRLHRLRKSIVTFNTE